MTVAVRFANVGFTYNDAERPTLVGVDLEIPEGEFVLVVGGTGSGKSTLLRAISGLVPRFSGGLLTGEVEVAGRSTANNHPRDLADVVGTVGQNPAASFVADDVEDELAYVMENLGVPPATMRRRVEDTLDLLDLADIRRRPLDQLSGGQQQRVAIAAVLAANPAVLVLDEPTSALDPAAADEVLSALQRLVHDLGLTVIIAEHRLERVVQFADSAILIPGNGEPVTCGAPQDILADPSPRPPVVRLGELVGWEPRPLTVRNARRLAADLRTRLDESQSGARHSEVPTGHRVPHSTNPLATDPLVQVSGLSAAYGSRIVLRNIEFTIDKAEIVAIMGRNGAGKSTLLAHLAGMRRPERGRVDIAGVDPSAVRPDRLIARVGLVPQDSSVLLFCETVEEECATSDRDSSLPPGTTSGVLNSLVCGIDRSLHPRDLSEGQRLALALSIILAPAPEVICLDEPTRGLDSDAKAALVASLATLAAKGHIVILATHDVELVAEVADRVIVLGDAEVVEDGPARRVICHSPVFSPQVARILAPAQWLTVGEVAAALGEASAE